MKHLATAAFLHPPSVSPPLLNTSYHFEITSQVPEGLSKHVSSSEKDQSNWYKQLSKDWRKPKPPPKTPEEASIHTLKRHRTPDLDDLLSFYGLHLPHSLVELAAGVEAPALADGLKFQLHTLPVRTDPLDAWESSHVPQEVQMAAVERNEALAERKYTKADALEKKITDAGYRVLHIDNQEILARKYRIRLRGIDAPERSMPYGKEAKDELVKIIEGKCLKILIFGEDRYGRFVGDVYCNGIFVQESLLKKGLAWHYFSYDRRTELEKWEKDARIKRVGLWASSNPEMPWVWRKNHRHLRVHA